MRKPSGAVIAIIVGATLLGLLVLYLLSSGPVLARCITGDVSDDVVVTPSRFQYQVE